MPNGIFWGKKIYHNMSKKTCHSGSEPAILSVNAYFKDW